MSGSRRGAGMVGALRTVAVGRSGGQWRGESSKEGRDREVPRERERVVISLQSHRDTPKSDTARFFLKK